MEEVDSDAEQYIEMVRYTTTTTTTNSSSSLHLAALFTHPNDIHGNVSAS
jgi:hypothetical protein